MKKEIKEAKIAKFQDQLEVAWGLIAQTPTGKDILKKANARGVNYALDFSLKSGDPGYSFTDSDGNKQVAINPVLIKDNSFGCFLETITHETIHASVDNKVDFIDLAPLDYCYILQLDEANAVARTLQIAHEMNDLGVSPVLLNYVNGEESGSKKDPMSFLHQNASAVYRYLVEDNPEYANDGTAMRAAFITRLTEDRKDRELSITYDENDLKIIQNKCIECQSNPCVLEAKNKKTTIETLYGYFLTKPEKLSEKHINVFSNWKGSNFLKDTDGSLKYLLENDMKTEGLNDFSKKALTKTNLIIEKTRVQLGLNKPSDNKAKTNLAQAKKQKGR